MKPMRRFVAMFISLCLSFYTMPTFAFVSSGAPDAVKVELSNAEMGALVGANGSADATMADYTRAGSTATAVFANRTTVTMAYALEVIDSNGEPIETLASGSLDPQNAILVTGTPSNGSSRFVRARIFHNGLWGLESKDASWAP